MKVPIVAIVLSAALGVAYAQAPAAKPSTTPKAAPHRVTPPLGVRSECAEAVGLCVLIPAGWQRLGNIFDDLGFVVAEPRAGDASTWPQLSVAAIDVPPRIGGGAPSLDALVDIVLTPDGTFTSAETQQRSRLLLNGADAEVLRVKLHDNATGADSIEQVALIAGEEGLVYSIALRCPPQDFARLDPIFQRAIHSWSIKDDAPAQQSKPKPETEKK